MIYYTLQLLNESILILMAHQMKAFIQNTQYGESMYVYIVGVAHNKDL